MQNVEVTALRDRHNPERPHAETINVQIEAGSLGMILLEAAAAIEADGRFEDLGPGRYHIIVGEPYDE
jgi:hypothetical protein